MGKGCDKWERGANLRELPTFSIPKIDRRIALDMSRSLKGVVRQLSRWGRCFGEMAGKEHACLQERGMAERAIGSRPGGGEREEGKGGKVE